MYGYQADLSTPFLKVIEKKSPGNLKNKAIPEHCPAPPVGLEPTTLRLTAACSSTDSNSTKKAFLQSAESILTVPLNRVF